MLYSPPELTGATSGRARRYDPSRPTRMSTTRPFVARPSLEPRSSWLLRGAFAAVGIALVVEALVVLGLVAYAVLLVREGPGPQAQSEPVPEIVEGAVGAAPAEPFAEGPDVWQGHGPVNVLLLGTDYDVCADPDVRIHKADTMILVRVDPDARVARMLSLPRDLLVEIPGAGPKKLTLAHYLGELWEYEPDGGPGLVKAVVRDNFQIPVHRFVRIDFEGFERIVDAVGPLTIDVPPNPNDPTIGLFDDNYPGEHCAYTTIAFPPGPQEMDGVHALQYARSRYSTSDFDRSRRQMQVLMAIRDRMLRPGILMDLPRLVPTLREEVDTDLSMPEIVSLGRAARGIGSERIERMAIDENVVYDDMMLIDGAMQSILQRDPVAWKDVRDRFLGIGAVAGDAPSVSDDGGSAPDAVSGEAVPTAASMP